MEGSLGSEVVTFCLTKEELRVLKEKASGEGDASGWISSQDALSAWFVEVLRSCEVEVNNIVNSINVSPPRYRC